MPSIEIKQLCNYKRFPNETNKVIALLLYMPIGVLLVLLRLVILLKITLLCAILPNTQFIDGILKKLLCITFGISINVENIDKKEDTDAFISNQVSILDHLAIHSLTGCLTPGTKLDTNLSVKFGSKYFGPMTNIEAFKQKIALFISNGKVPLFFQPESAITNGKGVLKFKTWPFTLCGKVQPVILDVRRPIFNININTYDSNYWMDAFYYMFSPVTVYNIQFLPSVEKKGLSETDFAKKVQYDIAKALNIEPVEHSVADLKEFKKRHRLQQQRAQTVQPPSFINAELRRMSLQVKEVFPMVPMDDILKDLAKTRNVDITITNILEGLVNYIPELAVVAPSTSSTSPVRTTFTAPVTPQDRSKDPFNTSANSFGKSATERNMSFQERKKLLIQNARKRYIEKQLTLNHMALNNC